MHILLVEDDAPLAESTSNALRAQGWRVDHTARGEPVALSLQRDAYDLLILDIGLQGIDGFETLRRARAQGSRVPVLMLTARDAVEDRVRGLEAGADDYLVKPFALSELVARSRALVRRSEARLDDVLSLGRLRLDLRALRGFVDGQPLGLSPREFALLQYLMLKADKIVPREQLVAMVPDWGAATSGNAVDLQVSRLRGKVERAGLRIRTVRGLGYLLEEGDPA